MPTLTDQPPPTPTNAPTPGSDPWTVYRQARDRLAKGGPDQLRVLIARALGALGLPEPAERWVQTIPDSPELAPLVAQIRRALPGLPPSRVEPRDLVEQARFVMGGRPDLAQQLAGELDTWAGTLAGVWWLRANDGTMLAMQPQHPIDQPGALVVLNEPVNEPERDRLENEETDGGPPPPVILDGVASAEHIADLCRRFTRLPNRAWARIYVCETQPTRMLNALASGGLDTHIAEDRLRFFVGSDAKERLIDHLRACDGEWSRLRYLSGLPGVVDTSFRGALQELTAARADEYRTLCAANNAAYAQRDSAWWADRYETALRGESDPLRVLVPTTRYSTYIQHASRDIVEAFRSVGHEAELLIEPDDSAAREGLAMARAVNRYKPDAIVLINYTRETLGSSVPGTMPHVCWIQDNMPHLHTEGTRQHADELTLFVGAVFTELITNIGVPKQRCMQLGVPASRRKFSAPTRPTQSCDLFIATNHGQSPGAMRDQLERECVHSGGPPGLLNDTYQLIHEHLDRWTSGHLITWLEGVLTPAMTRFGIPPKSESGIALIRDAGVPLVNRMLRHRLVTWSAELAETHGVRLRVAGRGWDTVPAIAPYAIGEITHGDALRDAYQDSAITLQTSAASLLHQRVHECLLAGGMPALMLTPDDITAILRPARAATSAWIPPTCSLVENRWLHCRALDDPILALSLSTAQRVAPALPEDAAGEEARALRTGLIPWRTGRDKPLERAPDAVPFIDQARFIDAISPGMFRTKDELLTLVHRATNDPDWRAAQISHARSLTERWFTYESACRLIIERLGAQLGALNQDAIPPGT